MERPHLNSIEANRAAEVLALALGHIDQAVAHTLAAGCRGKASLLKHLLRRVAEVQFDLECLAKDGAA